MNHKEIIVRNLYRDCLKNYELSENFENILLDHFTKKNVSKVDQ